MYGRHQPLVLNTGGVTLTWLYRSALLRCEDGHVRLILPGHPLDGVYCGPFYQCLLLIDWWRDLGLLPPPFVVPG
jgi:hypothetical protein